MALMSEERRKEMEEEMNRFELEIAVPGESKMGPSILDNSKPLSPPPPPIVVTALIPDVLAKPPPPPPPLSPPIQTVLRPPPPPPVLQSQPLASPSIRFIPPQLQRQPPRPQVRPNFIGMRGPPMSGPPTPFPPPSPINSFGPTIAPGHPMGGPHMSQVRPLPPGGPMHPGQMLQGGPMHPGAPMHPGVPIHPMGPMHPMPPGTMPMPSSMPHPMSNMNMNVSLPMPPGFCPPGPPVDINVGTNTNIRFEAPTLTSTSSVTSTSETVTSTSSSNENSSVVASAPTIYAAPFMKSQLENVSDNITNINGQENVATTLASSSTQKLERGSYIKSSNDPSAGSTASATEETVVTKKKEKKKKIVRMAGGQAWEDNSLLEWDTDDFRIFCGDLGNDVTDEVLIRAFSKYASFVKAKVIRDKRTNKTKGFGFVSFKDPQDFIKAMREMNGRYVGSRPIKLRKSTWRDRNIDIVKKKQREKEKLGLL